MKLFIIVLLIAVSIVLSLNVVNLKSDIRLLTDELEDSELHIAELEERLKPFDSLEELEQWLANDITNYHSYEKRDFNCIDFAVLLQQNALSDGYLMNIEVLPVGAHFVNSVVINDVLYIIEPQNDQIIVIKEMKHGGE